jgi:hypothetical protein
MWTKLELIVPLCASPSDFHDRIRVKTLDLINDIQDMAKFLNDFDTTFECVDPYYKMNVFCAGVILIRQVAAANKVELISLLDTTFKCVGDGYDEDPAEVSDDNLALRDNIATVLCEFEEFKHAKLVKKRGATSMSECAINYYDFRKELDAIFDTLKGLHNIRLCFEKDRMPNDRVLNTYVRRSHELVWEDYNFVNYTNSFQNVVMEVLDDIENCIRTNNLHAFTDTISAYKQTLPKNTHLTSVRFSRMAHQMSTFFKAMDVQINMLKTKLDKLKYYPKILDYEVTTFPEVVKHLSWKIFSEQRWDFDLYKEK